MKYARRSGWLIREAGAKQHERGARERPHWTEIPTRPDLPRSIRPGQWSDVEPPSLLARIAALRGVVAEQDVHVDTEQVGHNVDGNRRSSDSGRRGT